ncbi:hypothetical protein J5X98_12925 [Leptothermofonsia sichuanensis E412]|uniref:hypothetical protein n=1 Tax=Leptothermofonsia sichuanensis TaxID=2917832 RepID=UPI001CA620C8|nr:hypothetical protein [Leptothermofonsia sichuanensis]QZZ23151.1 hypothetical protein J5X98_12925 [Leptothermofonsia sichuanensis E412]
MVNIGTTLPQASGAGYSSRHPGQDKLERLNPDLVILIFPILRPLFPVPCSLSPVPRPLRYCWIAKTHATKLKTHQRFSLY